MTNLKFRYVYQHKEDFKIADTRDSIWTIEQIAEGEPNNYIDVCLSSSWKVININQYTGLKDKNGKEIFEGDIVKGFYNYYTEIKKAVVKFRIGRFEIESFRNISIDEFLLGNETSLEIIGNIYENPELLNS